jgi:uncharacterized membrane protein
MILAAVTFSGMSWLAPLVGFLIVAGLVLAWSYRASPPGWVRWVCLVLKLAGLAALAACLLEPMWFGERAKPGANLFAVVVDNSEGLQIKDRGETKTRGEQLKDLVDLQRADWQAALSDTFEVRRYLFDSRLQTTTDFHELAFDGNASGIGTALRTVAERFKGRPLAGVLLLTDGNATDLRGVLPDIPGLPPVYPVVIGRQEPVHDIAVQQVHVTQSAFEDAPVAIQADVTAAGYRGEPIVAKLVDRASRTVQEQVLDGGKDDETLAFRFQLKPEQKGISFYQVQVAPRSAPLAAPSPAPAAKGTSPAAANTEEATLLNNQRTLVVDRGQGPYRILYVAGRPNWEFKFINRAIQEDKEVELVSLIRVAKREPKFDFRGRSGESSNPLYRGFGEQSPEEVQRYDQPVLIRLNTRDELELRSGFPRTPEDLYGYHAVVLDDLEAEFFSPDQAALLQKFVSERGGGFLMLGGMESFREGKYQRTPIGDMLPVYLDHGDATTSSGPVKLQLAREGWLQPWARLRDNESDERTRQDAMPPFLVMNRVQGIKPGASVIATAKDERGNELPALVVQPFGKGRSAALMLGDVWKWGMHDAEAHVDMDKAWRQWMRYLVSDVPARVALTVETQTAEAGGAVLLQVRARDAKFQPLDDATTTIEVEPVGFDAKDAAHAPIRLQAEPALTEPGLYQATYVPRFTGGYKATAVVMNNAGAETGRAEAGWSTDLAAEEFRSLVPNVALLEAIARKTGGEMVTASNLTSFARGLQNHAAPVMETWSYPLWHTPVMFALALACLVAEWGLRRWKGMA